MLGAGIPAFETTLTLDDFRSADEIFSTGNAGKVLPITRFEERTLEYGPVTQKARELYWDFAHRGR
jgi:branched-chain amino acid aminotransferase